jgi:hypothetical protein
LIFALLPTIYQLLWISNLSNDCVNFTGIVRRNHGVTKLSETSMKSIAKKCGGKCPPELTIINNNGMIED